MRLPVTSLLAVVAAGLLLAAVAIPAAAQLPYRFPTAQVLGVATNCGLTNIIGYFEDASGAPVDGIAARITAVDGNWTALSNLSAGGAWNITIDGQARAGLWQVWADIDGVQQSPPINIRTDGPDRCGPDSPGVQTVWVRISGMPSGQLQVPVPGVPQPQPAPVPAPGPAAAPPLRFPQAQLVSTQPSCGGTQFQGRLLDENGNAASGWTVRIQTDDGKWSAWSFPADAQGGWNLGVAGEAIPGGWLLYVADGFNPVSPVVSVITTGPERCNPGQGGVNIVTIDFRM